MDEALSGGPLCDLVPAVIEATAPSSCPSSGAAAFVFGESAATLGVDFGAAWLVPPLLGVRDMDMAGGMVASDLDGDGMVDLLLTAAWGENALYLNDGDGSFTRHVGSAFDAITETVAASAVDLDGDGLREVALATRSAVRLFWNQGGGVFSEGTPLDTLSSGERASFVSWTDFDGDGNVDAYIGKAGACFFLGSEPCRVEDRVLRGLGGGAFEDVSERFGQLLDRQGIAMAGAWEDLDEDGDLDFLVTNDSGSWHTENRVFENPSTIDPAAAHDEVSGDLNLDTPMDSMGVAVADFTTGGALDVLISDLGKLRMHTLGDDGRYATSLFYASEDVPGSPGPYPASWAVETADLDLNGDLEIIVAWHWLYPVDWWSAGLPLTQLEAAAYPLKNQIFESGDFGYYPLPDPMPDQPDSWTWHTVSPVDLNADGAIDLVFGSMMGPTSIQMGSCVDGRHFLEVRLEQPSISGNRDALGAKVEITTSAGTQWRRIGVGSSGCLSARQPEAHFGLGDAASAEVRVIWPDGRISELGSVSADQRLRVIRQPEL